jgi:hypothetical protein
VARSRRPPRRAALALFATVLLAALPVVGPRSPTATAAAGGAGYWLAGSDGSVLRYGDAGDLGSLHGSPPARPVVGMSPAPTGAGYWLVAADGGIFAFGDAPF